MLKCCLIIWNDYCFVKQKSLKLFSWLLNAMKESKEKVTLLESQLKKVKVNIQQL